MKISQLTMLKKNALIAVGSLALSAATSFAIDISFITSVGSQPANVGTINLSQVDANTVKILVDLSDTSLPAPQYGFINTGGPHTPFTFSLAGSEAGVTASFVQPLNGIFGLNLLTLNLAGGDNTPYGTFGVAIDSSGGNGSGAGNAYYGDLEFNLIRTSGLLVTDFIANADGAYFAADLTDGSNTGAQAWKTPIRNPHISVPDSGATVMMLGMALSGLGMIARRFKK